MMLALVLSIGVVSQAPSSPLASADSDLLRAVADAADENRAKFPYGSIEFRHQDGRARNFGEAKAGKLSDSHEARCFYAYHDSHAIYEKRFSLASMTARTVWTSKEDSTSTLGSDRLLTNGKLTLTEAIGSARDGKKEIYGHVIVAGSDDFYRQAKFPLGLGFPDTRRDDVGRFIRIVLDGTPGTGVEAIDPDATLDGIKVVRIALRGPNGRATCWVDLERGAIPILIHHEVAKVGNEYVFYDQIRQVPGRGWLPFEETQFLEDGTARRTLIDRAVFDKPPDPKVFRMTTSRPVTIGNLAASVDYKPQPFYDLDNLPSATSGQVRPIKKVPSKPGPEARMPGEREPRPRYFTMAAVAVAALALGVVAYCRTRG